LHNPAVFDMLSDYGSTEVESLQIKTRAAQDAFIPEDAQAFGLPELQEIYSFAPRVPVLRILPRERSGRRAFQSC